MLIDLHSPATYQQLAELLGVPPTQLAQLRREGKLPADSSAPYIIQLRHYLDWLRKRAANRNLEADEALTIAKTENLQASTLYKKVQTLAAREELIDPKILLLLFQSGMLRLRESFTILADKNPDIAEQIYKAMGDFADYSENLLQANKSMYGTLLADFEKEKDQELDDEADSKE